jgi:hypothetical protein
MLYCIVDSSFLVVPPREKDPRDSLGTERKPAYFSGGEVLAVEFMSGEFYLLWLAQFYL